MLDKLEDARIRFLVIRAISRGGDFVIYFSLLGIYGMDFLPYAFGIAIIFHYTMDFFGQKFWVFKNPIVWSWRLILDLYPYLLIRAAIVGFILALIYILVNHFKLPLIIAGAIVGCTSLIVSFFMYRFVFTGKLDLFLKKLMKK